MIVTLGNLYYYPLKLYVFIAGFLYFKKLRVTGRKNVPSKGPVIFAINHQNALLDALLMSVITLRNPHFLTRGDVFKNNYIDKFLRGLKMLPVYRIRDGYNSLYRNDATFEAANEILQKGGVVGIFPEGSHSLLSKIRPLKKGIARIAFMAEERAGFKLNTRIIPVGIQYESHFFANGRTLISFGEPIKMENFITIYRQNENKGIDQLLAEISSRLKTLVINIENDNYEDVIREFKAKRIFRINLKEQLQADQQLVCAIESGKKYEIGSEKRSVAVKMIQGAWNLIWRILAYIPAKITDQLVAKTTRDAHFYGTMRFAYSIILYPLFFLLIIILTKVLVS